MKFIKYAILALLTLSVNAACTLPDLIVGSVQYDSSSGIFTSTVTNQGTAATPTNTPIGVRYSVDGASKTWGSISGPLAPGESTTIGTNGGAYTIPDGTHTITALVDDVNRFEESDETNNALTVNLTLPVSNPLPDLVTTSCTYNQKAGQFTGIAKNSGTATTPGLTVIGFRFLVDGGVVGTGGLNGPLDVNLTKSITQTTAPYTMAEGTHTVDCFVDDVNRIAESVETNNHLVVLITIPPTPVTSDYDIQGFAKVANVTGGAGGTSLIVNSTSDANTSGTLRWALGQSGNRVITFTPGTTKQIITLTSALIVGGGNVTLDGAGANVEVAGRQVWFGNSISNIIVKNMAFVNTAQGYCALWFEGNVNNVWVDHNTFSDNSKNDGATGDPLCFYNNNALTYLGGMKGVTVSWNHFMAPNMKSVVVGTQSSGSHGGVDSVVVPGRFTFHHNYYDKVSARNPRLSGNGIAVHAFNDYAYWWEPTPGYPGGDVTSIDSALSYLSENSIFEAGPTIKPATACYNYPSYPCLILEIRGKYAINNPTFVTKGVFPDSTFITYTYPLEEANDTLKARIIAGAGKHL